MWLAGLSELLEKARYLVQAASTGIKVLLIAENVRFRFMAAPHPFCKNGDRIVFSEVVDCDGMDRQKCLFWGDEY